MIRVFHCIDLLSGGQILWPLNTIEHSMAERPTPSTAVMMCRPQLPGEYVVLYGDTGEWFWVDVEAEHNALVPTVRRPQDPPPLRPISEEVQLPQPPRPPLRPVD